LSHHGKAANLNQMSQIPPMLSQITHPKNSDDGQTARSSIRCAKPS
jgi:hypothetical protein